MPENWLSQHPITGGKYLNGVIADYMPNFNGSTNLGLHLLEYTYGELERVLKKTGFAELLFWSESRIKYADSLGGQLKPNVPGIYLTHLRTLERLIALLPNQGQQRKAV